ncbi:FecCD family ABC transporter permease [Phytohabitans rumicis]|uniref:ABC transporter permease n=1 Tax=Phytohabitans rumicis TaxID=1076125 RepID=A0A6V8LT76_9ACTN|nr:iron chelate uptake ABC transporter family permease subunit [Phytohabitans rumicis]GFJ95955.1 ABC transporter permease [Phytohabitans rumicis]
MTVVRTPGDRLSMRVHGRVLAVCVALAVAAAGVGAVTMTTGDYPVPLLDVLKAIAGHGPPGTDFIVLTLRLPRLLTGLLVGAALGVSGAVMQRLSGNPLGSPDIIGFTNGSAAGAVIVILLFDGGMYEVAAGAVVGGLGTLLLVYGVAFRRSLSGIRLILIGIGLSAMFLALNNYLIARASLDDAMSAQVWLIGSLNGRRWDHVRPVALAMAVLLPIAFLLARRLSMMEMGDDAARALGVPVGRTRAILIVVSVALSAVATAAAGPIGFVALAAPQLARRLTRSAGPGLWPAALMGALLLTGSDLATQRLFAPTPLPVGLATAAVGGVYLAWLLMHEWRHTRA